MIVVVGLGSMGKRRIRLLKKIRPDAEIIGIDSNPDRCKAAEDELEIKTCPDLDEALSKGADYAFVCTSPLSHGVLINRCLSAGASVFTEINLIDDMYDENMALAKEKGAALYLSSTGLFRGEMRYMIDRIRKMDEPLSYVYHVGQYLPDWHPWESYKDMFIGSKRTNGCREILAIELPWITAAFGAIKSIKFNKVRQTGLDIDYCDNVMLLIEHERGHVGSFNVDVVCRKAVRDFRVYGENLFITWKGSTDSLMEYDIEEKTEKQINLYESADHEEGYSPLIVENAYESEILDFFEVAEGRKDAEHTFSKDKEILKWIDVVEA